MITVAGGVRQSQLNVRKMLQKPVAIAAMVLATGLVLGWRAGDSGLATGLGGPGGENPGAG